MTCIATQTNSDKSNFIKIGAVANTVKNVGNIKFDVAVEDTVLSQGNKLKKHLFENRFVFLAASTHEGEEALLLTCYKTIKKSIPNLILAIAPRHPERFHRVEMLVKNAPLQVIKRTSQACCHDNVDVFLIDTLGELKLFYASADVAFVGGSFVAVGGHNLLEPAAVGVPILVGTDVNNITFIVDELVSAQAAIQCETVAQLDAKIIYHLLNLQSVT